MSILPNAAVSAPPTAVGRYTILKRLAVGGMAELFLARAGGIEGFEKLVAIKRILPRLAHDREMVSRFLDEARLAAHLHHPNVVQVFDVGIEGGSYFIAMEFVHGQDLRAIVEAAREQDKEIGFEHVVSIVAGLAAGLHYAHERHDLEGRPLGIIHRDVSPSNVLVSYDGAVKLADFGIAKATKRTSETQHGVSLGKVSYMSPEQCLNRPVDRRSDVFAVGILLYELSTGQRLFAGASDFEVMKQVLERPVPMPSLMRSDYPPELERMVMRALAQRPEDRYPTAQVLQLELEDFARRKQLVVSQSGLEGLLATLFGKERAAWQTARDSGHFVVSNVTATDVDVRAASSLPLPLPGLDVEGTPPGTRRLAADSGFTPLPARTRYRSIAAVLVGVTVLGGGVAAWRGHFPTSTPPAPIAPAPIAPAPIAPIAVVAPAPIAEPPAVVPNRPPAAPPVARPAPTHATPARVTHTKAPTHSSRPTPVETAAPHVAPTHVTAPHATFDPDAALPPAAH